MALLKHTAVKLLHNSNVCIPTDTSESVVPFPAPRKYRVFHNVLHDYKHL